MSLLTAEGISTGEGGHDGEGREREGHVKCRSHWIQRILGLR